MIRRIIETEKAPRAVGPYSQAIETNGFIFTSGQIAINPASGKIESRDFELQVRQCLENISSVLQAAGSNLKMIIKLTVFLIDLTEFSILNKVFLEYFPEKQPARSAVQVSRLPLDALIEIEAVATVG